MASHELKRLSDQQLSDVIGKALRKVSINYLPSGVCVESVEKPTMTRTDGPDLRLRNIEEAVGRVEIVAKNGNYMVRKKKQ